MIDEQDRTLIRVIFYIFSIPYVVQCDIGNNGLQVMIRKDCSLSQANDEIMNVIPTNIPPDIVTVKQMS